MFLGTKLRCLTLLVAVTAVCAAFAPSAIAAPPPLVDIAVDASCAPNPVPAGSFITCDYDVTNNGSSATTCSIKATFFEAGVSRTRLVEGVTLDPGQTHSGQYSYRTQSAPGPRGGTFDVRVTCADQTGRQTTKQVRYTVV